MSFLDHYTDLPGEAPSSDLIEAAVAVCDRAYSPYSNVVVGVSLQTDSGERYVGCNVENASFGATMCAERSALSAAVSACGAPLAGATIVVVGTPGLMWSPCGICRQVIAELTPDATVHFVRDGEWVALSPADLLPHGFTL